MIRKEFYRPNPNPDRDIEDRKTRFAALNAFVTEHGGWLTSIPGDVDIRLEALPGSPLPALLERQGYIVGRTGQTQRILPLAIVQKFETSSSGALIPVTEGSTKPVSVQVTHAGIAAVEQYDLRMP